MIRRIGREDLTSEAADAAPTTQAVSASEGLQRELARLLTRWKELEKGDLTELDNSFRKANMPGLLNLH